MRLELKLALCCDVCGNVMDAEKRDARLIEIGIFGVVGAEKLAARGICPACLMLNEGSFDEEQATKIRAWIAEELKLVDPA